ncbi:MAG: hypothetical protein IT376_12235 [Polyangiaceae bacterium]|nr:hypothetical protein [Polyangiaceae bacterium]
MGRLLDAVSFALVGGAALAFALGAAAIGEQRDLAALYWLVVGGLVLRAAVQTLRPRGGAR